MKWLGGGCTHTPRSVSFASHARIRQPKRSVSTAAMHRFARARISHTRGLRASHAWASRSAYAEARMPKALTLLVHGSTHMSSPTCSLHNREVSPVPDQTPRNQLRFRYTLYGLRGCLGLIPQGKWDRKGALVVPFAACGSHIRRIVLSYYVR